MHTNTNAWQKVDRTIRGFLWDNASYRSAKFKMCFCKVILWLYAEVCGRRQHCCSPVGYLLMILACGRKAEPSSCVGTWIWTWGSYTLGSDTETHWGSSAVSFGEGRMSHAQSLLYSFLFRDHLGLDPKWRNTFLVDLIQTPAWQGQWDFHFLLYSVSYRHRKKVLSSTHEFLDHQKTRPCRKPSCPSPA